jgi:hypothetical protein
MTGHHSVATVMGYFRGESALGSKGCSTTIDLLSIRRADQKRACFVPRLRIIRTLCLCPRRHPDMCLTRFFVARNKTSILDLRCRPLGTSY